MHRDPQPMKMFTIAPMYRYGAPGKGRYREHWQASVEAIGSDDPSIDAELIQLYDTLLHRLGVSDYHLELNSIGCRTCRPAYLETLRAWLVDNEHRLDADTRAKVATSPLRVFDNYLAKPEAVRAALDEAPKIGESLCEECVAHFAAARADLDATGVAYRLVPTLVRGLDYYTRTTWEFIGPMDNENSTLSGGGRYDGLVEEIGGPPTPGVGFGAGLERLLIAMEDAGVTGKRRRSTSSSHSSRARRGTRSRAGSPSSGAGGRRRHGLCGPVAEGAADPGRAARRRCDRDRRPGRRCPAAPRARRRTAGPRRRRRQTVPMSWRDLMCGDLREEHVGSRKTLAGWVARRRDFGGLVFVDLRDRTGITQLVINPQRARRRPSSPRSSATSSSSRRRGRSSPGPSRRSTPTSPTGSVELQVDTLKIVSRSTPLPFQLDEENVDETLRLRYRWLDLRREKLQRNIGLRARMVGIIRRTMEAAGFIDIQTPILYKSTPEGARDFVVPSRLHKGTFFALPQSPQLLKQLTMIAGFDRYYQIAICFRDEDLRADRVQEITQLDMEMSFPTATRSSS